MKENMKDFLIHEVKCTCFDTIYIGNTQQILKQIMDGYFSNVQHILTK